MVSKGKRLFRSIIFTLLGALICFLTWKNVFGISNFLGFTFFMALGGLIFVLGFFVFLGSVLDSLFG